MKIINESLVSYAILLKYKYKRYSSDIAGDNVTYVISDVERFNNALDHDRLYAYNGDYLHIVKNESDIYKYGEEFFSAKECQDELNYINSHQIRLRGVTLMEGSSFEFSMYKLDKSKFELSDESYDLEAVKELCKSEEAQDAYNDYYYFCEVIEDKATSSFKLWQAFKSYMDSNNFNSVSTPGRDLATDILNNLDDYARKLKEYMFTTEGVNNFHDFIFETDLDVDILSECEIYRYDVDDRGSFDLSNGAKAYLKIIAKRYFKPFIKNIKGVEISDDFANFIIYKMNYKCEDFDNIYDLSDELEAEYREMEVEGW